MVSQFTRLKAPLSATDTPVVSIYAVYVGRHRQGKARGRWLNGKLQVYFILTTIDEEVSWISDAHYPTAQADPANLRAKVSIIFPQKWGRGKTLFLVMRYGVLVYISLVLLGMSAQILLQLKFTCLTNILLP